jgi:hypothetical protein
MFKVQVLQDTTKDYQPAARHASRGRVWLTVATTKRLAVAERTLLRVRTDWKTPVARIQMVRA